MNAKEFSDIINKIEVDGRTKEGILELIDLKSRSNMEPILNEIRVIQEKSDSGFKIINSDFKSEFKIIQQKSDSEFKRLEDKIDTKTAMLMWGIGIIMGLIGILITVLVALKFIR